MTEQTERQTRTYLMKLFEKHGIHPRWKLGQNFLIDLNLIDFVVREAELTCEDVVLEVGPGTGSMTTGLAAQAGQVISVELDPNMFKLATAAVSRFQNVTLLNQDALRNKNHLADNILQLIEDALAVDAGRRLKLVANLPYSVATPVISNLLATEFPLAMLVVTIQYELGLRMQALPGSPDYGALSVWLQAQCNVELLRKLSPSVFWPRPKVDSAVVKITPDAIARSRIQDRIFFHDYIRRVFLHRRKLLRGVLSAMYSDHLPRTGIDAVMDQQQLGNSSRAEELMPDQHVILASALQTAMKSSTSQQNP